MIATTKLIITVISVGSLLGCAAGATENRVAGVEETANPNIAVQSVNGSGYLVPFTAQEHANARFNTEVFTATVTAVGEPIRVLGITDDQSFSAAVYTPVDVQVTQTLKGETQPESVVRLRYLGGTADGMTFDNAEFPELTTVQAGQEVLVFGGPLKCAGGEDEPDLTPNFVMIDQDGTFFVPSLNRLEAQEITREELLRMVSSNG